MEDLGKIAYEAWRQSREDVGREEYMPWDDMPEHARSAWQAAAQAVRDVSPWIPVGERLPEENTVAFVWRYGCGTISSCFFLGGKWQMHGTVTHWMPMPEAPQ